MPDNDNQDLLYLNGINGETGDYDVPPMSGADLANFIKGESKPENLSELRHRYHSATREHLGVKEGVDPKKLEETGWGVIFAHDTNPEIEEALGELLALRQSQAGDHFRIYRGADGYRPNETKSYGRRKKTA